MNEREVQVLERVLEQLKQMQTDVRSMRSGLDVLLDDLEKIRARIVTQLPDEKRIDQLFK